MRALTLTEPWATLIAVGAKTLETRSWSTSFRGPVAIHAARGLRGDAADCIRDCDDEIAEALIAAGIDPLSGLVNPGEAFYRTTVAHLRNNQLMQATRGRVIATAEIIGCYRTEFVTAHCSITPREKAFGDYTPGRFAFRLANVVRLPEPIPGTGALGFWEWSPPVDAEGAAA